MIDGSVCTYTTTTPSPLGCCAIDGLIGSKVVFGFSIMYYSYRVFILTNNPHYSHRMSTHDMELVSRSVSDALQIQL
jgi:hypothetical protein